LGAADRPAGIPRSTFLSGAAGAATTAAFPHIVRAAEPLTIRYVTSIADDLRGYLYAQSAGLFKEAGLDVQLVASASGVDVAETIVGGAAEVGKASVTSVIAAYSHGLPFYLVAPGLFHRPQELTAGICVVADSPLKTVADLQGKIVSSTGVGSIASLGLRSLVDKAGGDANALKWVELPFAAVPPALEAGRIDAGLMGEPAMSAGIKAGKIRYFVDELSGYSRPILEVVSFSTREFASKNKDAITRFGKIVEEANNYANTHVAETLPPLVPLMRLDVKTATDMRHGFSATTFDANALQPVIDLMVKYKQIPATFDARELLKPV
jgi:NitT/TauT family transport system substrate-binding protein